MSRIDKLDYIATRILAEDRKARGITSHRDMKETGILSTSQYERRQSREIYSNLGHLEFLSRRTRTGKRVRVIGRVLP